MTSRRRFWVTLGVSLAVLATFLNGIAVGYGSVWLQLFGERPDAGDYRVSTGGYGAAALVLALTVPALIAYRLPRSLLWLTSGGAAVLALAAVRSGGMASRADDVGPPSGTVWEGVGGVLWTPWAWALLVVGTLAIVRPPQRPGRE